MLHVYFTFIIGCFVLIIACKNSAPEVADKEAIDYSSLTAELETMYDSDQEYRRELTRLIEAGEGFDAELVNNMNRADSINQIRVIEILDTHGWIPKSEIGEKAFNATFLVIQHAPLEVMERYLPSFKKLASTDASLGTSAALMEDRVLMYQNKPQIYGSQSSFRQLENGTSEYFIWPIVNPLSVNERRQKSGFETTIEEYAESMNVIYNPDEPLTMFGSN